MHVHVYVPGCTSVYHVFLVSEKIEYRETGFTNLCMLPPGCWYLNSGSLQGQPKRPLSLQSMDIVLQRFLDFWHFEFLEK